MLVAVLVELLPPSTRRQRAHGRHSEPAVRREAIPLPPARHCPLLLLVGPLQLSLGAELRLVLTLALPLLMLHPPCPLPWLQLPLSTPVLPLPGDRLLCLRPPLLLTICHCVTRVEGALPLRHARPLAAQLPPRLPRRPPLPLRRLLCQLREKGARSTA